MDIILLTIGIGVVGVAVIAGLSRAFSGYRAADLLDWKPTRSPAVEAQNEVDDVRQMIEAQNELRRKRGAKEITEADVHRQAAEDQQLRRRGIGPFKHDPDVVDELDGPQKELRPPKNPKPRARNKPKAKAKAKPKRRG